jgi:hypothetical protein
VAGALPLLGTGQEIHTAAARYRAITIPQTDEDLA